MQHEPDDPFGWPPADGTGAAHPAPHERNRPSDDDNLEVAPPAEPSTALTPPPKRPGTALATSAEPPPPPRPRSAGWRTTESRREVMIGGSLDLVAMVNRVLDTLDVVGDRIAEAAGIRPPSA